jgi:hypothetical protein
MNEKIQDYIKNRLFDFLDEAKPQGYGSNAEWTNDGPFKTIAVTDTHNPEVKYTDRYVGAEMFSGVETVTFGDKPIYAMSYSGVEYIPFKEDSRIFECLSKALTSRDPDCPNHNAPGFQARGLNYVMDSEKKWIYLNKEHWVWSKPYFSGTEIIISVDYYNHLIDKVGDVKHVIDILFDEMLQKKNFTDMLNDLMGNEDNKKWLAFRCDYSGVLIED